MVYITVKGKLSKYCVKSIDGLYYFLTKAQNMSFNGYFLLKPIGTEYQLLRCVRTE